MYEMYQFAKGVQADTPKFVESLIENQIQSGDIIFQTSKSEQSKAIQLATKSKYSHMGIIYRNNDGLYVYEAIEPVKRTPIKEWINRGENGEFVVKRLKNAEEVLTKETLAKMKQVGNKFIGKHYDLYFEWSDDRIYCSELVWKIYKEGANVEIGELQKMSDFDISSKLVKEKMKERYGDNIPMNEKVISPAQMFKSDELSTVLMGN
ncbi:MAG: YiiX family permuted papain-like enzyme [Bacteroidetes bacterium]|nr:YiiX family permuted papain-like enzyme [Bacteroidota bacterium]